MIFGTQENARLKISLGNQFCYPKYKKFNLVWDEW